MSSEYEKAAEKLAALPRAERFESLLDFPTDFSFKVIGRGARFGDHVRELVDARGLSQVILVERPSKQGRFVSITFNISVTSGAEIDDWFSALEGLPGLALLL